MKRARWMSKLPIVVAVLLMAPAARAVYNANIQGELAHVAVYGDGDYIYFTLKNQPTAHPGCNPSYFVFAETLPSDRRRMLLARLLTAYAMKEVVNVGFDSAGDCVHGYIRAHRVG